MLTRKPRVLLLTVLLALLVLAVVGYLAKDKLTGLFFRPTGSSVADGVRSADNLPDIQTAAEDRPVPWSLAWLPDGDMLLTERPGTLQRIGKDRQTHTVEGVTQTSEGGLLGLALHPEFARNRRLYLYLTVQGAAGLENRIESYRYEGDRLNDRKVILQGIPGASNHDGGRLAFGPDGYLYVTTGDAANEDLAQDRQSLAGKILRMTDEGRAPADNPFGNLIYSYGHRNPQGLAWDGQGRLWSTEHGRSGARSGFDELNLIEKGGNYGWPVIEGDGSREGMVRPVAHSGASETWAPGGLAYLDGSLFFGGLRGRTLYEARIRDDASVELRAHFRQQYGRLRTTAVHDGRLYLTTSNTDGRGEPRTGDDRILSLNPSIFR